MFKKCMNKMIAAVLSAAMVLGCVPSSAFVLNAAAETVSEPAAQEEFAVSFDQEYAAVGEELSVTAAGASDVTYTWYVDGVKIDNDTNSYTPSEAELESWIEVIAASGASTASAKMYFSKLPVIYIDTEGGQAIVSKEEYIDANLRIQGNETYNSETTKLYDGLTEIRGRGNSTWAQPKKPYRLKLDKKTDVFGMGKSKHWVLLANYMDESLMRNTYAYDLSGSMGMEQCSTVWVDVVLNGDYVGNYQFCENIRVDDTRVDIFDWEGFCEDSGEIIGLAEFGDDEDKVEDLMAYMCEKDMSWITSGKVTFEGVTYNIADYPDIEIPDINGGYILELDEYYDEVSKFKTESGQPIMFKEPEYTYTNKEMMKFVQTYVQAFENAVESEDYCASYNGVSTHYSELYDFDALVDYWLICEIFFQEEINKKSTYMYKDIDELMMMGPIWDMDWSSGGEGTTGSTTTWATLFFNANAQKNQWYKYLVQDPYFRIKAQERYWEIRYAQLQDMLDRFDADFEYLVESAEANGDRWGYGRDYAYYANHFDTWMNNHVAWMDEQMGSETILDNTFYHGNDAVQITLADMEGTELKGDIALKASADYSMKSGDNLVVFVKGSQNVSGLADIYVNSRLTAQIEVGTEDAAVEIPAEALTAEAGEKNVVEVKVGNYANYVTVREKATADETGVDKSELETLIYENADKESNMYSPDSWENFEKAYADACAAVLNNAATQEEVAAAKEALEGAIAALVELRDPSDDSDDYDVKKITFSAGSSQNGEGIELAFDGNENTIWHSEYQPRPDWYGTEDALDHFWVIFELEEATSIEALRYLPRNGNGDIKGYRIEGSLDGESWSKLAEGSWEYNSAGWLAAEFDNTEVKYIRLWATETQSSSGNNRHVSARELRLRMGDGETTPIPTPEVTPEPTPEPSGNVIPVSEMKATAGDAQPGEGPEKAIDEDENTMWHTDWKVGPDHSNHWIQFELSSEYRVDSLRYLPRQSGGDNGIVTGYEIWVSTDGENWKTVAEGTWEKDTTEKNAQFEAVTAKYVRLVVTEAATDQSIVFASAAEIRLTGVKAGACEHVETELKNVKEATCTEDGYTGDKVCKSCGDVIQKGEAVKAAGHAWGEWYTVKEPAVGEDGLKVRECESCHTKEDEIVPALEPHFEDVKDESKWYFDAVYWGHKEGIVNGLTETTFGPGESCTRGQIVTFIWRAEGKPEAKNKEHGFTDIVEGKYYYDAVVWAVEEGIVNGLTETTFGPEETCTRAQMATFLYRHAGEPEVTGESAFSDLVEGKWYYNAALWANEEGIVTGYEGGIFAPNDLVTRAQTVTMLYRYLSK